MVRYFNVTNPYVPIWVLEEDGIFRRWCPVIFCWFRNCTEGYNDYGDDDNNNDGNRNLKTIVESNGTGYYSRYFAYGPSGSSSNGGRRRFIGGSSTSIFGSGIDDADGELALIIILAIVAFIILLLLLLLCCYCCCCGGCKKWCSSTCCSESCHCCSCWPSCSGCCGGRPGSGNQVAASEPPPPVAADASSCFICFPLCCRKCCGACECCDYEPVSVGQSPQPSVKMGAMTMETTRSDSSVSIPIAAPVVEQPFQTPVMAANPSPSIRGSVESYSFFCCGPNGCCTKEESSNSTPLEAGEEETRAVSIHNPSPARSPTSNRTSCFPCFPSSCCSCGTPPQSKSPSIVAKPISVVEENPEPQTSEPTLQPIPGEVQPGCFSCFPLSCCGDSSTRTPSPSLSTRKSKSNVEEAVSQMPPSENENTVPSQSCCRFLCCNSEHSTSNVQSKVTSRAPSIKASAADQPTPQTPSIQKEPSVKTTTPTNGCLPCFRCCKIETSVTPSPSNLTKQESTIEKPPPQPVSGPKEPSIISMPKEPSAEGPISLGNGWNFVYFKILRFKFVLIDSKCLSCFKMTGNQQPANSSPQPDPVDQQVSTPATDRKSNFVSTKRNVSKNNYFQGVSILFIFVLFVYFHCCPVLVATTFVKHAKIGPPGCNLQKALQQESHHCLSQDLQMRKLPNSPDVVRQRNGVHRWKVKSRKFQR